MENYLRPSCVICGTEVEQFEYHWNARNCSYIFIVGCHGDTDTWEMADKQIHELKFKKLSPGFAFTSKRLAGSCQLLGDGDNLSPF